MALRQHPQNNVIKADTLNSTTAAGIAAVIAGIAGALPPILEAVNATNVPRIVQFGGLILIGLATVAWAIATAGDALARAYASGHVEIENSKPALADAIKALAANYQDAAFGIQASDGRSARKPATALAIERLADAQENASLGTTSDQRSVPERAPALAEAIKALADAHRSASLGIVSDRKGVEDQRPGVELGLEAVAAALSKGAGSTAESRLVAAPAGIKVTVDGQTQRVLGALLTADDPPAFRLLVVDATGNTTLLAAP